MSDFPLGYRTFHADESLNYELNRWLGALPEDEIRDIAPRIDDLADWRREMTAAGERAERDGRLRTAAFYCRAVEFFLDPDDEEKLPAYERFVELFDARLGPAAPPRQSIRHGMHVCGARDAFELFRWLQSLETASFSHRITQDFLLLAGSDDHIVPLEQFYRQARNLPNVRSFTGRIFGAGEEASHHCQIGNVELALRFIVDRLDFQTSAEQGGLLDAAGSATRSAA